MGKAGDSKRLRSVGRGAVALACIAVGTGAIGVAEAAAPTAKVVSRHGTGTISAPCPTGKVATGGGARVSNPDDLGSPALTRAFLPPNGHGVPTKFDARISQFNGNSAAGSAYAVCVKKGRVRHIHAHSETGTGTITATCPSGQVATGGGALTFFAFTTGDHIARSQPLTNSHNVPRGWKATIEAGAGGSAEGGAYAACVKKKHAPPLKVRRKHGSGGFSVGCKRGQTATGGGVSVDQPAAEYLIRSQPLTRAHHVAHGWKAGIRQGPGAGPGTAFVVCAG